VGNPTIVGFGIDYEYAKSDQKKWNIKHRCGKHINPDFFQHVVREVDKGVYVLRDREWKRDMNRDIYPICPHCNKPYDRHQSGLWIPSVESDISGYP
jgi:phage terminase large subunit GpA-like protein